MHRWLIVLPITTVMFLGIPAGSRAQQTHVTLGNHSLGESFTENIGSSWGFQSRGLSFNFGGGLQGGPGAANFGFSSRGPAGGFNFFGSFGQGANVGMTSQSPMVTVLDGQSGSFFDTSLTPFVLGVVPVVGGFAPMVAVGPGATTVQLPTFRTFGVSTSVAVPDQGTTTLGGVDRAADGQNQQGLPGSAKNSGIGSSRGANHTQVSATIHDFQKADQALLGAGAGVSAIQRKEPTVQALAAAQGSTAGQAAPSVNVARRLHAVEQDAENADARQWFERGQAAERDAEPAVAKIYYQMAARRATGEFKESVLARLLVIAR